MAQEIADIIEKEGVKDIIYGGAEPNPTDKNVQDGFDIYTKEGCDLIVSVGGGSSHDCAKGIGLVAGNGGRINDYEGVDKFSLLEEREKGPSLLLLLGLMKRSALENVRHLLVEDT